MRCLNNVSERHRRIMAVAHNPPVDCTVLVVREKPSCSESQEDRRGTVGRTAEGWISFKWKHTGGGD